MMEKHLQNNTNLIVLKHTGDMADHIATFLEKMVKWKDMTKEKQ